MTWQLWIVSKGYFREFMYFSIWQWHTKSAQDKTMVTKWNLQDACSSSLISYPCSWRTVSNNITPEFQTAWIVIGVRRFRVWEYENPSARPSTKSWGNSPGVRCAKANTTAVIRTDTGVENHIVKDTIRNPRNTVSSKIGARTPVMPSRQAVLIFDEPINGNRRTSESVWKKMFKK